MRVVVFAASPSSPDASAAGQPLAGQSSCWRVVSSEGPASLFCACCFSPGETPMVEVGAGGALAEPAPRFRASCLGLEEALQEASLTPGYRWEMQHREHSEPCLTVSSNSL